MKRTMIAGAVALALTAGQALAGCPPSADVNIALTNLVESATKDGGQPYRVMDVFDIRANPHPTFDGHIFPCKATLMTDYGQFDVIFRIETINGKEYINAELASER